MMRKALIKKQLKELFSFYYMNRKTGKRKSTVKIILTSLAFFILFALAGYALYGMDDTLAELLLASSKKQDWLYFALLGGFAFLAGVIGSAFQTCSSLYLAKDNELLLSMPLSSSAILLSRMISVMASAALFTALVWIPGLVKYALIRSQSSLFWPILVFPFMIVTATVFSCALGALVALISRKLKGKSIARILLALSFFAVYYLVILRMDSFLTTLLTKIKELEQLFRTWLFPLCWLGRGAAGSCLLALGYIALSVALLALCIWILSLGFHRMVGGMASSGRKRREQKDHFRSVRRSLLHREWRRYISSSAYVLNTVFGLVFLPGLAIFAFLNRTEIKLLLLLAKTQVGLPQNVLALIPTALFCGTAFFAAMSNLTASSVSLEGSKLWVIRSLPVRSVDVLCTKRRLHLLVVLPFILLSVALLSAAFFVSWYIAVLLLAADALFVCMMADIGLLLNLKMPNFKWTNETIPVKQSAPVTICLFGGWVLVVGLGVLAYYARDILPGFKYLIVLTIVETVVVFLLEYLLRRHGTKLLESLL